MRHGAGQLLAPFLDSEDIRDEGQVEISTGYDHRVVVCCGQILTADGSGGDTPYDPAVGFKGSYVLDLGIEAYQSPDLPSWMNVSQCKRNVLIMVYNVYFVVL